MRTRTSIQIVAALALTAATSQAQASLYDIPGQPSEQLGRGLSSIADLDGDGLPDVLVGAPKGAGLQAGAGVVRVYSSKTSQAILTLKGEVTGDDFGWSVAALDDVTGDGKDEIIVGAPGYDSSIPDLGAAYVFSGATGALLTKKLGFGQFSSAEDFGHSVCAIGDYNLDGKADFAVGAPKGKYVQILADGGYVVIYSGATFAQLKVLGGYQSIDSYGTSIARVGDLNGDGRDEFIVGGPTYDASTSLVDAGSAYVQAGGTGAILFSIAGTQAGQTLGFSVAGVPDTNGDGKNEFAVGEPDWSNAALYVGRVRVFSGSNFAVLRTFTGTGQQDFMGNSIAGVDDFDGDGRGDIVVGSSGYDNSPGAFNGRVDVFSVHTGSALTAWVGYQTFAGMGSTVASAGDLNNDGTPEVMGSAPVDSTYTSSGGYVRIHLGNAPFPNSYCTAKVNSLGCTPGITYGGAASLSIGGGLAVVGVNVIPGFNGLMIWSNTSASVPFFGGTLCVGAPIKRTPVQSTGTNLGYPCTGQYYFQADQAFFTAEGLSAGQDFYAQYWSRDTGFSAPNNVGLTNGLHARIIP